MTSAMEQLKAATQEAHQKLETLAYSQQIMNQSLSLAQYQTMMCFQHHLHAHLEPQIIALEHYYPELQYAQRRSKVSAIEKDLNVLGLSHRLQDYALKLTDPAAALGCAYVLEGATLGGQIIQRKLRAIPEIAELDAMHYYALYGNEVRSLWLEFKQAANTRLSSHEDRDSASKAAVATFRLAQHILIQLQDARTAS